MTTYATIAILHHDLRQCCLCAEAGYPVGSQPVFSGQESARLFLIGQAPGAVEGTSRKPFSRPSGKRLFRWLEMAGWSEEAFRERCYISAVTKCFPGKHANGRGDRVPTAAERALCRPWLDAELALVDPQIVVPVGRLAINLFFDSKRPLADIVGTNKRDGGRLVVPLPHPSGASAWTNDPENLAR